MKNASSCLSSHTHMRVQPLEYLSAEVVIVVCSLKHIECHALGFQFRPDLLCHKNSKAIRRRWRWRYLRSFLISILQRTKTFSTFDDDVLDSG
ncbi:hypothetical protein Bca4012_056831 [Brassica carinata]